MNISLECFVFSLFLCLDFFPDSKHFVFASIIFSPILTEILSRIRISLSLSPLLNRKRDTFKAFDCVEDVDDEDVDYGNLRILHPILIYRIDRAIQMDGQLSNHNLSSSLILCVCVLLLFFPNGKQIENLANRSDS